MKRTKVLLFSMLIAISNQVFSTNVISKTEAWEIVKKQVLLGDTSKVNVFISNNTYEANSTIKAYGMDEKSPDFTSWFLFIDDSPFSSWGHPCRYVFVNAENGRIEIISNTRPPHFENMKNIVRQKTEMEPIVTKINKGDRTISTFTPNSANHDYAVIISGGMDSTYNYPRYWNDCSALYSTLINKYGYQKSHIYVLMADGTDPGNDMFIGNVAVSQQLDLDGDGINDIQYAATKQNITSVFNILHNQVGIYDNLLIFTTDHGGVANGNSYLILWGNEITSSEFATEVNKVNAANINICLEQCYSGGFISDLQASNRVITTACRYDEVSYGGANYDTFAYQWISALAGETVDYGIPVDADTDSDGIISMREAYEYAIEHDQNGPLSGGLNIEHPQYSSTPTILGRTLSLYNGFTGTYYNGISTNDINLQYPLFTNFGGYVEINSPNIKDATVTYQGTTPTNWLCNTITGYLKVTFPSNGGSINVKIQRNGVEYNLTLVSSNITYMPLIRVNDGIISIELLTEENGNNQLEKFMSSQSIAQNLAWRAEIYNAMTGEKVFDQEMNSTSSIIQTSGWIPGVYIVRITIGDYIQSKRIVVK